MIGTPLFYFGLIFLNTIAAYFCIVNATATDIIAKPTLLKLWGEDIRTGSRTEVVVAPAINAEWQEVSFPDEQPEQQGRMLVTSDGSGLTIFLSLPVFGDDDDMGAGIITLSFQPVFLQMFPLAAIANSVLLAGMEGQLKYFSFSPDTPAQLALLAPDTAGDPIVIAAQRMQAAMGLLAGALNNIVIPVKEEEVPACRFLAYDSEREKILDACTLIQKSDGKPFTIRELSRKVAMNECYLKKGFKALTGKTIHEYQQDIRIARAKEMLKTQGVTVTDVALTLGYSSISHFSTAFKRVTGLKPCELLS